MCHVEFFLSHAMMRSIGIRTQPSPWVPHLAFCGICLMTKLMFPFYLKWLACDSISTLLLSVWYPLCSTVSLIHRNQQFLAQAAVDENEHSKSDEKERTQLQSERQYWIEYWSIGFAGVQFLHSFFSLFPFIQHMCHQKYTFLPVLLSEAKFLFFVWIFSIETLLSSYRRYSDVNATQEGWKEFYPLTFIARLIEHKLISMQTTVSEQISKETWDMLIHSKAQRFLEGLVFLQIIHEDSRDYSLQLLDEGRSVLLLSIFMVLPSSVLQFGILYVQFVLPSSRSLNTRGNSVLEVLSLKYWVLNNLLSSFISFSWWLWWWIPFSNQIIFGIRCFYTFPSSIVYYYSLIETELITFGILAGKSKMKVKETKTVQALRAIVKRLPRDKNAASFQFELSDDDFSDDSSSDDSSLDSSDASEKGRRRRKRRRRRKKRAKEKLRKNNYPPDNAFEIFDKYTDRKIVENASIDTSARITIIKKEQNGNGFEILDVNKKLISKEKNSTYIDIIDFVDSPTIIIDDKLQAAHNRKSPSSKDKNLPTMILSYQTSNSKGGNNLENVNDNDGGLSLSDIDTVESSMIEGIESFDASDGLNTEKLLQVDDGTPVPSSNQKVKGELATTNVADANKLSTSSPRRRSARLLKLLRNEQEQGDSIYPKKLMKSMYRGKDTNDFMSPTFEGSKFTARTSSGASKKLQFSSGTTNVSDKSSRNLTSVSPGKRSKRSPSKKNRNNNETSLSENRSPDSKKSPDRKLLRKIPNSGKKRKGSSMFGVLSPR